MKNDNYYSENFANDGVDVVNGTIKGVRIATEGKTTNGDTFDLVTLKAMMSLGKDVGFITYLCHPTDGVSPSNRDPSKIIGHITGLYLDKEKDGRYSLKGHWQALKAFKNNDKQSFDTLLERAADERLSKTMSMSVVTRSQFVFKVGDKEILWKEKDVAPDGNDGNIYCRPIGIPSVDFVTAGAATGGLGLRSADEVKPVEPVEPVLPVKEETKNPDLFKNKENKFMKKETLEIIKSKYSKYLQLAVEQSVEGISDEDILKNLEEELKKEAALETENKLKEYAVKVEDLEKKILALTEEKTNSETKVNEYSAKVIELTEKFSKLGVDPIDTGEKKLPKSALDTYNSITDSEEQSKYLYANLKAIEAEFDKLNK